MTQLTCSALPCLVGRAQTFVMIRSLRWGTVVNVAAMLALLGVALGCGMRGPPLPPLVFVPGSVTNLEIERQRGFHYSRGALREFRWHSTR